MGAWPSNNVVSSSEWEIRDHGASEKLSRYGWFALSEMLFRSKI